MRATIVSGIFLLIAIGAWAQPPKRMASGVRSGRAVLRAYVSAWNRHDFAALDEILAPDAVHEDIALGVYAKGIAQVKDFMQKVIQSQPDLEWRVSRFVESGPVVVAEWTWTSTFTGESPSGPVKDQRVSGRGVSVVTTENGQIKHLTDYYDLPSFFRKANGPNRDGKTGIRNEGGAGPKGLKGPLHRKKLKASPLLLPRCRSRH